MIFRLCSIEISNSPNGAKMLMSKTCSCCPVCYFGTLINNLGLYYDFWYKVLLSNWEKNLFWTNNKFVYLNIITNFCPKLTSEIIIPTTWKGFWRTNPKYIHHVQLCYSVIIRVGRSNVYDFICLCLFVYIGNAKFL